MKYLIIILCLSLIGCSKSGISIQEHQHIYNSVLCGDGLTRIQCTNYPCKYACLFEPKTRKYIIVVDNPKEYWEVSESQAEIICSNPQKYITRNICLDSWGYNDPGYSIEIHWDNYEKLKELDIGKEVR